MGQALQHGYLPGDRTLGVMPLYHTMGIHSLLAMHLVGGCFVPQARWDRGRGAAPDRGAADHVALPRADALPRPARTRAPRRARHLERSRARVRRRADDVDARQPLPRDVPARGLRQPLRLDRDLHLLRRPRAGGQAGVCRTAVREHAPEARRRTARSARTSRATRRSPATGTGPTPTQRRSATAGTTRATPATSTPTATSGSTAGSTT